MGEGSESCRNIPKGERPYIGELVTPISKSPGGLS